MRVGFRTTLEKELITQLKEEAARRKKNVNDILEILIYDFLEGLMISAASATVVALLSTSFASVSRKALNSAFVIPLPLVRGCIFQRYGITSLYDIV